MKCHIIHRELFQQSNTHLDVHVLIHLWNIKMVFCHTSDWFPFKELTVSTHTHCRSGCVQRESFIQEPLHNCSEAIVYPGLVIQHGHQPCPSVLSSKREACFKKFHFFPSGFVSAGHGGLTYRKGHVPSYLPRWIMTGHLWWGWGSMCSCPGIWSNPAGQGNPNSPTCAELM